MSNSQNNNIKGSQMLSEVANSVNDPYDQRSIKKQGDLDPQNGISDFSNFEFNQDINLGQAFSGNDKNPEQGKDNEQHEKNEFSLLAQGKMGLQKSIEKHNYIPQNHEKKDDQNSFKLLNNRKTSQTKNNPNYKINDNEIKDSNQINNRQTTQGDSLKVKKNLEKSIKKNEDFSQNSNQYQQSSTLNNNEANNPMGEKVKNNEENNSNSNNPMINNQNEGIKKSINFDQGFISNSGNEKQYANKQDNNNNNYMPNNNENNQINMNNFNNLQFDQGYLSQKSKNQGMNDQGMNSGNNYQGMNAQGMSPGNNSQGMNGQGMSSGKNYQGMNAPGINSGSNNQGMNAPGMSSESNNPEIKEANDNKNQKYSFKRYTKASQTGLVNLGDTSYLNSVLQLLGSIRSFSSFFLNPENQKEIHKDIPKHPLSFVTYRLIHHLYPYPEKKEIYPPESYSEVLASLNIVYKSKKRRNPNDLLSFILLTLHEELKKIKPNEKFLQAEKNNRKNVINCGIKNFVNFNNSIVSQGFTWFEIKETRCQNCNITTYNFHTYNLLELNILECFKYKKGPININDCLIYQSTRKTYNLCCFNCKKKSEIIDTSNIYSSPNIFIFSLNRGDLTQKDLLDVKFAIEEKIDITFLLENKMSPRQFELIGILSLINDQQNYTYCSFCRSPVDNQWYYYNDQTIEKRTLNSILKEHEQNHYIPCILVYKGIQ